MIRDKGEWLQTGRWKIQISCKKKILYRENGETLNKLPRETMDAPSLGKFKANLDRALNNLF